MHIAWGDVEKQRCVAEAILDSALVLATLGAWHCSLVRIVEDMDIKANRLVLIVSYEMTAEAIHARYAK